MWFRRDLRLRDHPALRAAADARRRPRTVRRRPGAVAQRRCGATGVARGLAAVRWTSRWTAGSACGSGRPSSVVPLMAERGGRRPGPRDQRLHALRPGTRPSRGRGAADDVEGVATGTPYAVAPGTIVNGSGQPYKVFTPYSKAWRSHGWDDPLPAPRGVDVGRGRGRPARRADARQGAARGARRDADARRGRRAGAGSAASWTATSTRTTTSATIPAPTAPRGSRRT